ncbi:recombinase family protein [Streptomyces phaeochromogenes]|uniref:recombinase family protein n=1 Tax=Streptomyces phaeochromogenes TaxID=1923 RepID=UPI0033E29B4C
MNHLAEHGPTGSIPVASYARTSEDVRRRDGHGVRNQLRINERTAHEHGWTVVAVYSDNGRSVSKAGEMRPGFDRLVADLARGHTADGQPIKGVVCTADDRLYRRAEDLARFFAALTAWPECLYLDPQGVRDPYSQEGLLEAVRALDAATTETRVRSRLSDWHWARAVDGVPHSGPRPFGWQEDRITLHADEAQLVEQAIIDRTGGKAVRSIARDWCDLGVSGTRGGRPNAQTVTQIMTAPRVCGYRANKGELLIVPETRQPVLGQWEPIVTPTQWHAVCETFSPGSLYLHRGSGAPRLTGRRTDPCLASGFLRCGAARPDGGVCRGALCAQKGRSKKSPYVYSCRSCGRCSISGPLAHEALEQLLFPGSQGRVKLPESMRRRWQSGEMGLEEKRKTIGSVFTCCIVRPGVKGDRSWDYSRVEPVWRWADRVAPTGATV